MSPDVSSIYLSLKKKKGNSFASDSIPQDDILQDESETTIKSFPQFAFLYPMSTP